MRKKLLSIITAALVTACIMSTPLSAAPKVPNFVKGKLSGVLTKDLKGVHKFFNDNKEMFSVQDATQEFTEISSKDDELGLRHIKVQQVVDGIPVYGGQYIVHFNKSGEVYAANGYYDPTAKNKKYEKLKFIPEALAIKAASKEFNYDELSFAPPATLYLYEVNGELLPVYEVNINFLYPEPGNWYVYVNALTGDIVHKLNKIETISATGTGLGVLGDTKSLNLDMVTIKNKKTTTTQYQLHDITRGNGITTYTASNGTRLPGSVVYSSTNVINDKAAVDAHYYAGVVYDFYKNIFNRNSIDGNGFAIKNTVHYSRNYVNAFWNGSQMVYGDGDGVESIELSGALDVIGHEMTHGVDEKEANLTYAYQPGALNESLSDCFGYMIEYYGQLSKSDWLVGEDVWTPGTPNDALRSISDPTRYGQPENMSGYRNLPNTQAGDWGGVHTNSGIPNKAFYNTVMNISSDLSVSVPKVEKIYYSALCNYMTSSTDFSGAKSALAQAAADNFGANSAEYNAVISAWSSVGVN